MKNIPFIAIILALCLSQPLLSDTYQVEQVRRLLQEEALFLNSKLKFQIFGCGGSFSDTIDVLELTVQVPGKMTLPKARLVFVAALRDWMNRVNCDTLARPYYKNYPMLINNFEFRMILPEFDEKSDEESPKIALIFNVGDKIVYCYRKESGALTPFLRESYDQAVKKITTTKK